MSTTLVFAHIYQLLSNGFQKNPNRNAQKICPFGLSFTKVLTSFGNMCPEIFYSNFFEIRLTSDDVWAKSKVQAQGHMQFLCFNLGSYLLFIKFRDCLHANKFKLISKDYLKCTGMILIQVPCTNHIDKRGRGRELLKKSQHLITDKYLVKVSKLGRGPKIAPNSIHVVCTWPLIPKSSQTHFNKYCS